jgi:hypothetical protein
MLATQMVTFTGREEKTNICFEFCSSNSNEKGSNLEEGSVLLSVAVTLLPAIYKAYRSSEKSPSE